MKCAGQQKIEEICGKVQRTAFKQSNKIAICSDHYFKPTTCIKETSHVNYRKLEIKAAKSPGHRVRVT